MQKKIIALAVAGIAAGFASAPVFAQSQVTLYGSFDGGVRHVTNVDAAGDNNTTMGSNGTYNSNRWGMKGSEDMGNGLKAHFVLEGGFNTGTGAMDNGTATLFSRSAYVGLDGGWGSFDLGRQYTVIFKTTGAYDPFNYKYTGIIPIAGLDGARHNNEIQYAGNFGPVTARVSYAFGEVPGSSSAGSPTEIGASYADGPISFGAAYMAGKQFAVTSGGVTYNGLKTSNWTVGGAYSFAPFRIAAGYDKLTNAVPLVSDSTVKNAWIGGSWAMSPQTEFSLAYYDKKVDTATTTGKNKLWIFGGTYAFSKRTNFYADLDRRSLSGNQKIGAQDTQMGVSVGINHLF